MSNYVEFDGVKTAHRITSTQNGVETIIEIDSVSYNALAENAFELPSEIQTKVSQVTIIICEFNLKNRKFQKFC